MVDRQRSQAKWFETLLGLGGPEVTCEQCFADLDRFVEVERSSGDEDLAFPGMRAHLEGCPACREEHDLLVALLDES